MKFLLKIILCTVMVLNLMACDKKEESPKKSFDDGVIFRGFATPIGALRNIKTLEMILGCLESGEDRYVCQCGVDNTFMGMTADEVLDRDWNHIKPKADKAKRFCKDSPKEKIPKTIYRDAMTMGEIRSFIEKEIMLDCMGQKKTEQFCQCFSEKTADIIDGRMGYLKIIDTRQYNMFEYSLDDKNISNKAKKIYKDCEHKKS